MRGRTGLIALVLVLVALAGVGWLVYGQVDARDAATTATTERDQATDERDQAAGAAKSLADQVTEACAKGGPAAAELGSACAQAARVQATPVPAAGRDGDPGRPGRDGVNGSTPACYAEPNQCRGADGKNGVDGAPGPACPPGYELRDAVITAPDGSTYSGRACVDPATSAPPSTSPPTEGTP